MSPKKDARKSAKHSAATTKKGKGFTAEEIAAMKERVRELKAGEEPTAFALKALTATEEARISELVRKAVS